MIQTLNTSINLRRWVLGAYWTGMYVLTHWPHIEEWAPKGWNIPQADKFIHASMYGGWMVLWWWVLASQKAAPISRAAVTWLVIGGALYGIFDETTQALVERTPSIADWSCDLLGLVLVAVFLRIRQLRRSPSV